LSKERSASFDAGNNARYLIAGLGEISNMIGLWIAIAEDYSSGRVTLGDGSINAAFGEAANEMSMWMYELNRMSSKLQKEMDECLK
jgi:hypothetical protein